MAAAAAGDRRRRRGAAAADRGRDPRDRPPTLVACGDRDPFVPVGQAWALARAGAATRGCSSRPTAATSFRRPSGPSDPGHRRLRSIVHAEPRRRPMTTLLALYRRPDGGPEALAEFERRYGDRAPAAGRGDARAARDDGSGASSRRSAAETDLVLVTAMEFDDRAALDAGLASDAMRAAGRNLREIAPGPGHAPRARGRAGPGRSGFPGRGYCRPRRVEGRRVTRSPQPRSSPRDVASASRSRRRPRRRRRRPASLDRRRARDDRPAARRSTRSASTCSTSSRTRSRRSTPTRPAGRSS